MSESRSDGVSFAETPYAVYLIKTLTPNFYYVGWTSDVDRRWEQHKSGRGAKFTRKHGVAEASILCRVDSTNAADDREKLYAILLQRENPMWVVSVGAVLKNKKKFLRKFGYPS
jgi:predicted GIY-YIG superfamily endonuclease